MSLEFDYKITLKSSFSLLGLNKNTMVAAKRIK
jgi:hypothetical protein